MKGLLIKDLCSISNYKRQYATILVFMSVWSIFSKSFSFLAMYSILLGGMMVLSVMSMDEAVHFNRYALTMPISVKTLVKEKYVLVCICIGAGSLLALIVEGIAMSTPWYEGTAEWIMINCLSSFFLIAYTITLPIIFKYGVEKARYTYMAVILVMGAVIGISVYLTRNTTVMLFDGVPHLVDNLLLTGGLLILDAIVLVISYQISLKAVRDKEW